MAKFKIDENWDGVERVVSGKKITHPHKTVKSDGTSYGPSDIFSAPKSLGEGRPWLILQSGATKVTDKSEAKKDAKEEKVSS